MKVAGLPAKESFTINVRRTFRFSRFLFLPPSLLPTTNVRTKNARTLIVNGCYTQVVSVASYAERTLADALLGSAAERRKSVAVVQVGAPQVVHAARVSAPVAREPIGIERLGLLPVLWVARRRNLVEENGYTCSRKLFEF